MNTDSTGVSIGFSSIGISTGCLTATATGVTGLLQNITKWSWYEVLCWQKLTVTDEMPLLFVIRLMGYCNDHCWTVVSASESFVLHIDTQQSGGNVGQLVYLRKMRTMNEDKMRWSWNSIDLLEWAMRNQWLWVLFGNIPRILRLFLWKSARIDWMTYPYVIVWKWVLSISEMSH